jgi:two-component system LytT family response regulator
MNEPKRMTVVIVDDEAPARALIREYLQEHADMDVVAECANGLEAVKAVNELRPDLLFLDIQMPKLSGFEVLDLIGREAAGVVFTTAYDEYALRAFEVHAVDYLLKPFGPERFAEALALARSRAGARRPPARALLDAHREGSVPDRLLIRDRSNVHVIPLGQIDYIEAQDDYVSVRAGGRNYLKEQTLGELEEQLTSKGFLRIHRRYILNVSRLARIELAEKDSRVAILNDKTALPISRSGYAKLRELL